MRASKAFMLAAALLTTAFAGCSGEDDVLKAAFVFTALNADKSEYKFDASASTGKGLKFSWDFGDRTEAGAGEVAQHKYDYINGEYDVTLTVTDGAGAKKTITQAVPTGTGTNTEPLLYLSVDKRRVLADEEVFFDGSMSVDADGDPLFFEWDFNSQLDDQTLNNMENLGNQAYGRYPDGKAAPAGAGSGNESGGGGSESALTPSGHDWRQEVEKARQRVVEQVVGGGEHGGEEGAAEPRNTDHDGKIEDTSPVQFYKFPSPAVYYVHVRVEDIKGDGQEGFIKISVDTTVPPASNSTPLKATLRSSVLAPAQGQNPAVSTQAGFQFRYELPGTTTLNLKFTVTPDVGAKDIAVYVCSTNGVCDSPKAKLEGGASDRTLSWKVGPDETLPYPYYVVFVNEAQDTAEVAIDSVATTEFDINPWAKDEAGFGGAHH